MIDIQGQQAKVLAALYNASKPLGLGIIQFDPAQMSSGDAQILLDGGQQHFDYLKGRVMKVDLSGDSFDPFLYDRDNGEGAAARAVEEVLGV